MGDIGWQELLVVLVILLLIFGASRLPALSKSLGQSIHGFKKGLKEGGDEAEQPKVAETSQKDEEQKAS